jgi:hypothetical protein
MFKRKGTPGSSRSSSPAALDIDNDMDGISVISINEDIPHPVMAEVIINNENDEAGPEALNEDTLLNPEIHFRYTTGHPMGSILLRLLNENMKLGEKVGHKTMDLSAQELSTQFYNWQLFEKQRLKSKIKQTAAGLEDSILTREMQSHTINQSIEAPNNFSAVPTLLTARQRADCFKLLPSGPNKFSGEKGVNILEYLHNLRTLQNQMNLSLPEFYEAMLASTTGNAYLLINSWIENNESPSTIFHNLLIHYDTRLQPEEARARLMTYKALKSSNLGKVEADIMKLASRAASSIPAGPGRTANYNMEVVQGLIRSLPHASSLIVQNQNMEKSAKLGRMLTAAELSRYLNIYRHAIDSDIKSNGVDSRTIIKRFIPRNKGEGIRKFSAYNLTRAAPPQYIPQAPEMVTGRKYHLINQVSQNNKPVALGGNYPFNNSGTSNMITNGLQKNWSNRQQQTRNSVNNNNNFRNNKNSGFRGGRNNSNFTPRRPFNNNRNRQFTNTNNDYCSLCGKRDHRASDSCRFMVSDTGARVPIMPTKTTCTKCPPFVNPRLSHPENLCPYRKSGPWGKQ